MQKIISIVTVLCFLVSNVSFAIDAPGGMKLAVPSKCDDLIGIEAKDIGDIELWFKACLQTLKHKGLNIAVEDLRKFRHLPGNTIFHPKGTQFFIDEVKKIKDALRVMVRRKDDIYGLRTYYAEFSNPDNIEVYPEGKSKERTEKDIKTIDRSIEHEEGIDAVIKYAHEHSLAKEPLEKNFSYQLIVDRWLGERFLNVDVTTPDGLIPIEERKFYLVNLDKLPDEMRGLLKTRVIAKKGPGFEVDCVAHSSNNAEHVFVRDAYFNILTGAYSSINDADLHEFSGSTNILHNYAHDYVQGRIIHEIGVMLGYSVIEVREIETASGIKAIDLIPINILDKRYEHIHGVQTPPRGAYADHKLKATVVDLNTNLDTRDYAAGEEDSLIDKVSIYIKNVIETSTTRLLRKRRITIGDVIKLNKNSQKRIDNILEKINDADSLQKVIDRLEEFRKNALSELPAEYADLKSPAEQFKYYIAQVRAKQSMPKVIRKLGWKKIDGNTAEWSDGVQRGFRVKFDFQNKTIEVTADGVSNNSFSFKQTPKDASIQGACLQSDDGFDGLALSAIRYSKPRNVLCIVIKDETAEKWLGESRNIMYFHGIYGTLIVIAQSKIDSAFGHLPKLSTEILSNIDLRLMLGTIDEEIASMIKLASKTGLEIPTHPDERYTLLLTSEFFANGELGAHQLEYGERFELDEISGQTPKQFIKNVIENPKAIKDRTIALVPDELPKGKLKKKHFQALKDAGIRFIITNRKTLLEARAERDTYRKKFQIDTYATMLTMRRIDGSINEEFSIYQLLSFYIKSHFKLDKGISVKDYIHAIVTGDIATLIKGHLSYRPAEPFDVLDYDKIAATLISA